MNRQLLAVVSVSMSLLVGAITVGLRIPESASLAPFAGAAPIDYSAGPLSGFAPLDPTLVAQLLGAPPQRQATQDVAAGGRSGVRRNAADTVPIVRTHAFGNDAFGKAYPISSVPFTGKTNTSSASVEPGEPSCSVIGGGTAWYAFTPGRDVGLVADTFGSDYATTLSIYQGPSASSLSRVGQCTASPRGNALVSFAAKKGTRYFFQISGPIGGNLVFSVYQQGVTTLASVPPAGASASGDSFIGVISPDGARVMFASGTTTSGHTCVPADGLAVPCGQLTTFLRDRITHDVVDVNPDQAITAYRASLGTLSAPGGISADGRYAAFFATVNMHAPGPTNASPATPYRFEVFRRDNLKHRIDRVSLRCDTCDGIETNGTSARAEMTPDGRYIAFVSEASNIVPGDTNGTRDVFVRDMVLGVTDRVNVPNEADRQRLPSPAQANGVPSKKGQFEQGGDVFSMSEDGRYVVFKDSSSNLVVGDTNGVADVFVRDRVAKVTERVNVSSSGQQADDETRSVLDLGMRTISRDGRYVFFNSDATNLDPLTRTQVTQHENIFRRDRWRHTTTLVSVGWDGSPANAGVDAGDARWLAFSAAATVLLARDNLSPIGYSVSADGRFVVFSSDADNLVPGDDNSVTDVFMRDIVFGTTTRVSVRSDGTREKGPCHAPTVSADGLFVAFACDARAMLDSTDTNNNQDVYVRELPGSRPATGWR